MTSLFDAGVRDTVQARVRQLTPDAAPAWGTLTAPRMLRHLVDSFDNAMAKSAPAFMPGPASSDPLRHALIHEKPWPEGKLKAPPEYLASAPTEWGSDQGAFDASVDALIAYAHAPGVVWGVHPAFGPMTRDEWGTLCLKHINHHFRQFGV